MPFFNSYEKKSFTLKRSVLISAQHTHTSVSSGTAEPMFSQTIWIANVSVNYRNLTRRKICRQSNKEPSYNEPAGRNFRRKENSREKNHQT